MLYLYSAGITPKLIDVIAKEPRILRYLDMPMQHASDTVLARMRRVVGGPHHQLSAKYLPAYIDERRWLSENEDNPHVFRDTISALLEGEGISYERLVAAA